MASRKDWIPGDIPGFVEFQGIFVSGVAAGAAGWGISAAKVTTLQGQQTIYLGLYATASNPATRTKGSVQAHKDGLKVFKKQIRSFVSENLRGNPLVTNQNRIDLKIPVPDDNRTPRAAITTVPDIILHAIGEARVQFELRVENDSNKPSMHPDCDVADVRAAIGNYPAPPNIEMATDLFVSTKARFIKTADLQQMGQTAYVWVRWKNNTDDSKSGPFNTTPVAVVIR